MKQVAAILLLVACQHRLAAQDMVVEITAGRQAVGNTPVYIPLKKALPDGEYELVHKETGRVLPAQLADSVTLVFIPGEKMDAGTTRRYMLRPARRKWKQPVRVEKQVNGLLVTVGEKPVFFYHTAVANPPPGSPDHYKRSGFIHPLFSPDGNILTDDFPAGHMHQHGIFMAWVNTTFRGQPVDFWNQHSKTGTVEHAEVISIQEGPVLTRIKTRLRHLSLAHGPVLEEVWTITVYPFTKHFLFDLESEQVNITADTLFLHKYHYGGLAFRGSREWNGDDSPHFRNRWQILTSEGKDTATANHTPARWVDASGKVNGKMNGLTIFGDPANYRYPQSIRVHPDMPYWCYAPVVDGAFTLPPGLPYRSRFRFMVHTDSPNKQAIEKELTNWTETVRVIVK